MMTTLLKALAKLTKSSRNNAKREDLKDTGRGTVGKTVVHGVKDRGTNEFRAQIVTATERETLHPIIRKDVDKDAMAHTDDACVYDSLPMKPSDNQ